MEDMESANMTSTMVILVCYIGYSDRSAFWKRPGSVHVAVSVYFRFCGAGVLYNRRHRYRNSDSLVADTVHMYIFNIQSLRKDI